MKRILLLFIVFVFTFLVAESGAVTVEEIVKKNIEAKGGQEKFDAIKTIRLSGMSKLMGIEAPVTVLVKKPAKYLSESVVQGIKMKQVFDGETAWMQMGDKEPMAMPEAQAKIIKENVNLEGMLLNASDKGYKVELVGEEEVSSTNAYHLKVVQPKKYVSHVYVDAGTFLEFMVSTRSEIEGTEFSSDMHFSDYKSIDGVMMAHTITMQMGQMGTVSLTYDKIEFNVELDDSLFTFPGKIESETEGETESD